MRMWIYLVASLTESVYVLREDRQNRTNVWKREGGKEFNGGGKEGVRVCVCVCVLRRDRQNRTNVPMAMILVSQQCSKGRMRKLYDRDANKNPPKSQESFK